MSNYTAVLYQLWSMLLWRFMCHNEWSFVPIYFLSVDSGLSVCWKCVENKLFSITLTILIHVIITEFIVQFPPVILFDESCHSPAGKVMPIIIQMMLIYSFTITLATNEEIVYYLDLQITLWPAVSSKLSICQCTGLFDIITVKTATI